MGIHCADHVTPLCPQKLALTSPTGSGGSVGIVRSRTKATEFYYLEFQISLILCLLWSQDSTIFIVTKLQAGVYEVSNHSRGKRFFCAPKHPDQPFGLQSYSVVTTALSLGPSSQIMRLTTHVYVMMRLRMRRAIPLLPLYAFMMLLDITLP